MVSSDSNGRSSVFTLAPMNETLERTSSHTASQLDLVWQKRLDAVICGECSEDDFIEEISSLSEAAPDSAWNVVAFIDQRYRRGQIPADLFRSIESKIAQRELVNVDDYGTTANLHPAAPSVIITQRFTSLDAHAAVPNAAGRSEAATPARQSPPPALAAPKADDPPAARSVEIGRVLRNRYVLQSRLGSGGMGTVFKALDRFRCDLPENERHVAIKILHEKIASRSEVPPSLRREFFCAQALAHRNIVKVFELDLDEEVAFFAMELLHGELLSGVIEHAHPPISRPFAWAIIRDVAAGLAHAHTRNVIHADLKPQNIMITHAGEVRILDFGASSAPARQRAASGGSAKNYLLAVTPAYASCELLDGQDADPRDDLYALACVSYELLAGEHPFQRRRSTEARELGMTPRRPPGLNSRQWQALQMGLSWSREGRSISVRDWLLRLQPRPALSSLIRGDFKILGRSLDMRLRLEMNAPLAALAACALVSIGLIFGLLVGRSASDAQGGAGIPAAPTAATAPIEQGQASPPATPAVAISSAAPASGQAAASAPAPSVTAAPAPAVKPPAEVPKAAKREPARAVAQAGEDISIVAGTYRVRPGQNFAEVRVRRSAADGDSSFTWWTEDSTAKFGVDYIPQGRTTQVFSKGQRFASLFVKVVPNTSRKRSTTFYVAIGQPSGKSSIGRVARTVIALPPSK